MEIREDDLSGSETLRLVEGHLANMHDITPPGSVHALGVEALRAPDVTLWSVWEGDVLLGCGALKALSPTAGEVKAMRTDEAHRRKGVGATVLEHILGEARRRGYRHLYLETGALPAFAPGRALYTRYGFTLRGPFGDYTDDPNSVFMELAL
jgi:putative acetyltransferase